MSFLSRFFLLGLFLSIYQGFGAPEAGMKSLPQQHQGKSLGTDLHRQQIQQFLYRVLEGLRRNTIDRVIKEELGQQPESIKKAIEHMLKAAFAIYPGIADKEIQILRLITQGLPQGTLRAPLSIRGEAGLITLEFVLKNEKLELSDVFVGSVSKAQELGLKK